MFRATFYRGPMEGAGERPPANNQQGIEVNSSIEQKTQNPTNTLWVTLEVNISSVQLSLGMTKALDNTWSPSYDRSWATGPSLAMVAPDP